MPCQAGHHPSGEGSCTMLCLSQQSSTNACSAHVLPCRIRYNGHANSNARYWHPHNEDSSGDSVAYFRGRKMSGRQLKVPSGYRGAMLSKTDRVKKDETLKRQAMEELEAQRDSMDPREYEVEADELQAASRRGDLEGEEMILVEELASFQTLTVWGHESSPRSEEGPFLKGLEEWMSFAASLNATADAGSSDATER